MMGHKESASIALWGLCERRYAETRWLPCPVIIVTGQGNL